MNGHITLRVVDIVGDSLCISGEDGQKVFEEVQSLLTDGKDVTLSFQGVRMLISLFLNVAIGQLYGSFGSEVVDSRLSMKDMMDDDLELLDQVIENAKKYYANPKAYDLAWEAEEDDD